MNISDQAAVLPFLDNKYRKTNLRSETELSSGELSIYEFSSSEFLGKIGLGIALNTGQDKIVIEPHAIFGDDGLGGGVSFNFIFMK